MVFSSEIFLFFFLPVALIVYYLIPCRYRRTRNFFLLVISLFFYAWGEPKFVEVLILSILVNYAFGIAADRLRDSKYGKAIIFIMVIFNLGIFFKYKYLDFAITNINHIAGHEVFSLRNIALPIGISFFTFQAMSYVIDVYRRNGKVQYNPLNVGLYITFFPQLIAGPIVRYETVANEINSRTENPGDISGGIQRFVCGLAKKVILSNGLAAIADYAYNFTDTTGLSTSLAWLGSIAYMLQIYFDFSGYSDMAIGLGRMFGFHFNENFNYPYISDSITDFWRRWHISLSQWFRDYVYIPLGGSRCSKPKTYRNLAIVWILTGVWHGASWNFVLWGIVYLVLLVFEKSTHIHELCKKNPVSHILYRIFTLLCVNFAWVLFRSPNLTYALNYLSSMFHLNGNTVSDMMTGLIWRDAAVLVIVSVILATPVKRLCEKHLSKHPVLFSWIKFIMTMLLFMLCIGYVTRTSYDPFIYFNF